MSNYLDEQPERFIPPTERSKRYRPTFKDENLEDLNNDERELVSEDFEDSPFADRTKPIEDEI